MNPPTPTTAQVQTPTKARTQYIFIDYENVCEADLSRIVGKPAKVFMVLGVLHKNLPVSLFVFSQKYPGQLRIIQTPVQGRNALDMVLAVELGRILAEDPEGCFHIVSKDNDYESVVRHLKAERRLIARYPTLKNIPQLHTEEERFDQLRVELEDGAKSRPGTRKKLENRILSAFGNKVEPAFIEKTIKNLVHSGILDFTETDKVLYKLA
jgi:hypothetical protein